MARQAIGLIGVCLLCLAASAAIAQDTGVRVITGAFALPEGSSTRSGDLFVLEARAANGDLLGETSLRVRVPGPEIDFSIGLPAAQSGELRAAVFSQGEARWAAAGIALQAGGEDSNLGSLDLPRHLPARLDRAYRCGDTVLRAGVSDEATLLTIDRTTTVLARAASSEGTRYEASGDPETSFLLRGANAEVSVAGEVLPVCAPIPPFSEAPYRAQGNEPGWRFYIADGRLGLSLNYGSETIEAPTPQASIEGQSFVHRLPEAELTIRLTPGICRDTMTGMPYPETAELRLADATLTGCGGDPVALLAGGEWTVVSVDGRAISTGTAPTFEFDPNGAVSGQTGCNRFATSFRAEGEGVAIGPIAATRRACPDPLMSQEQRFLAAFAATGRFDLSPDGELLLFDLAGSAPAVVARR